MKNIVAEVLKINKFDSRAINEFVVKDSPLSSLLSNVSFIASSKRPKSASSIPELILVIDYRNNIHGRSHSARLPVDDSEQLKATK